MAEKIFEELKNLARLEEIANQAEANYDRDLEDEDYERAYDLAYENEYNSFMKAATMLSDYIGVDIATARAMVNWKRSEVIDILKRGRKK